MNIVGLLLTLAGATLLFLRSITRKELGNVILTAEGEALQFKADAQHRDVPRAEWEPIGNALHKQARLMNQAGFALVAIGTLLQVIAAYKAM